MKTTTLLFAICCFGSMLLTACTTGGQTSNTDSTITGDKVIKSINFYEMEGDNKVLTRTEHFNKKGLLEREENYYDGEVSEVKYAYDEKGNEIEKVEYNTDGTIDETEKKSYEYDGDKILKELVSESDDSGNFRVKSETSYAYNDKGQCTNKATIALYGTWTYTYTYQGNGEMETETIFAYDDTEKVVKQFNEEGKRVKEDILRRKTQEDEFVLARTNTWKYNADGTVTSESIVDEKVISSKTQNPNDSSVIKEVTYY